MNGCTGNVWLVVTTRPNCEAMAANGLSRQGIASYLPRFRHYSRPEKRIPLFPGYLFVSDFQQSWRAVLDTRGVGRMITDKLPEREITRIREQEDETGLVKLPDPFAPGTPVHVTRSRFLGRRRLTSFVEPTMLSGICDGMSGKDRVFVLLRFLGRLVRVPVPKVDLVLGAP
jgi:transcriptional antiterminator RfaH